MLPKISVQQKRPTSIRRRRSVRLLLVVLFTACLLAGQFPTMAQDRNIQGRVTTEGGTPVTGASVTVKGSATGTTTNNNGEYKITAAKGAVLLVSSVGYISKEITVGDGTQLDVSLDVSAQDIDAVVVVGYGTQRKRNVTGSIGTVSLENMENAPNTNIGQYLQGTVPGLNVGLSTFAGGTPPINIRGRVTISGSQSVVIIVDGIQYNSSLSSINPDDISSIDILKDASATAVYGAQGANGVILITTKKGKYNQPTKVTFSSAYTTQKPSGGDKVKPKNREEFLEGIRQGFWNQAYLGPDYTTPNPAFKLEDVVDASNALPGRTALNPYDYNWYDEATNTGSILESNITLTGGGDRVTYLLSGGLVNQKGFIINDKFNRKNVRANVEIKAMDWWKVGLQSYGSFVDQDGAEPAFGLINIFSPLLVPYDSNGNVIPSPTNTVLGSPMTSWYVDDRDRHQYYTALVYSDLDIPFIKGLKYRMNFGQNLRNDQHYYASRFDANQNGRAYKENQSLYDYTFDNILTYDRTFGKHGITVTALYGSVERRYERTFAEGTGFSRLNLSYNGIGGADVKNVTTNAYSEALNYQMGKLNYSFDEKYLLQVIVRRDGFSGFAENFKYAVFPSVSLGWIMSDEKFMQNVTAVNFLKLRAGYGVIGNQTQRYFSIATVNTNSAYVLGDNNTTLFGQQVNTLGNPNLKWERTKGISAGIDFAIFNNRLSGNLDYYNNTTNDLLFSVAVPNITGFGEFRTNLGEIHNTGWEVGLNAKIVANKDFNWTAQFNIWGNKNTVEHLTGVDANGDGKEDDIVSSGLFIGKSLGAIFDYQAGPIYQLDDPRLPGFQIGSLSVTDLDKNGMINAADRMFLGKREPAYSMSLFNSLSYKGFTFSFMLNSIQGGKDGYLGNNVRLYFREDNSIRNNDLKGIDFWSPTNPNGKYPRIISGTHSTVEPALWEKRSFVRLQDISIGYNFPASLLNRIKAQSASIYLSGKNLATWTNWDGWDPEGLNANNAVQGMITDARPVLIGLNIGARITF